VHGSSQFPKKNGWDGLRDRDDTTTTGEPGAIRTELSAHLSNPTLFRRAFISLDWVPRGVCTEVMRYVGWEDEGLSVRWLWATSWHVDASPIEPGDEDEPCKTPCKDSRKIDEEEWPRR
jgi:hypothetical protein